MRVLSALTGFSEAGGVCLQVGCGAGREPPASGSALGVEMRPHPAEHMARSPLIPTVGCAPLLLRSRTLRASALASGRADFDLFYLNRVFSHSPSPPPLARSGHAHPTRRLEARAGAGARQVATDVKRSLIFPKTKPIVVQAQVRGIMQVFSQGSGQADGEDAAWLGVVSSLHEGMDDRKRNARPGS